MEEILTTGTLDTAGSEYETEAAIDLTDLELDPEDSARADLDRSEEELLEKIGNLPYFVLNQHPQQVFVSKMEFEDLAQEMRIEALRAIRVYKRERTPERGQLTTLAVKYMEQRLLRLARLSMQENRKANVDALSMNVSETVNAIEARTYDPTMYRYSVEGMETNILVEQTRASLANPKEIYLFDALLEGKTNKDISDELGVSPQTIGYHTKLLRGKLKAFHKALISA